ncbi:PH domain-containing protein [Lysinibacillus sphaericus]|uniref:PH domain-containing protein n=1 Tax=Lysinibacillus sphaericus TaxID=1421 RepID=UPI00055BF26C|nr:PH domain-containing protein [Lysinibacillus sphaericus]
MVKALNCPNCAATFNPEDSICEYCGSYIITSEAKQLTYDLNEFKPTYKKIFFHEIEMCANELPVRSGMTNIYYSATKSDGGRLLLTNQRLIFCAHALNINPNLYWEISLKDVDRAELGLNLFISQRIKVFDVKGNETTFVVYGGKTWLEEIGRCLN